MPDIDPYYYLRFSRNIIDTGHIGDEVRNGCEFDNHLLAPEGDCIRSSLHARILAYIYKIMKIFNSKITLMQAAGYFPVIFAALTVIPVFFITRRIIGDIGGFFAGMMIALNIAMLNRTTWGHPDTDAYNVFFPLLILWIFIEAFYARSTINSASLQALNS